MPWYKCEYQFGPGHQSSWTTYVYKNYEADEKDLCEDVWEDGPYHFSSQVSGTCEKVEKLPRDMYEKLVKEAESRITAANRRLELLRNCAETPVERETSV